MLTFMRFLLLIGLLHGSLFSMADLTPVYWQLRVASSKYYFPADAPILLQANFTNTGTNGANIITPNNQREGQKMLYYRIFTNAV